MNFFFVFIIYCKKVLYIFENWLYYFYSFFVRKLELFGWIYCFYIEELWVDINLF